MNDDTVAIPRQRREREEVRQRKLAALRSRLHAEAQAVRTPEDWARCLRLAARLPGESFANILLISAQRPGATLLHGYDAWRTLGRQVGRQEKGIAIFSAARQPSPGHKDPRPGQAPAEPVPSWRDAERVAYLWDLSQTSGPAVTESAAIPSRQDRHRQDYGTPCANRPPAPARHRRADASGH